MVLAEQAIELGAVALRQPRGLGDIAVAHLEQLGQIVALELFAGFGERQQGGGFEPQRSRHRGGRDAAGGTQRAALLDHVHELAHVAGPVLLLQQIERVGREAGDAPVQPGGEDLQRMLRQHGDVFASLAQRRQVQGDDIEAVIQVVAKLAEGDGGVEIAVGGGDDAHVHIHRLRRAQRAHLALLQHAQQLDLQRQRHIADLVEKQRAAAGLLEQPGLRLAGAGERTLGMAEKFRLEQGFGNGGAVDGDERPGLPRAGTVNGAGQHFLAGARLAANEHAGLAARHQSGFGQQCEHARTGGENVGAPGFVLGRGRGGLLGLQRDRTLQQGKQLARFERLGQKAEHAALRGVHRVGNGAVRGEDDDRQRWVLRADVLEQRQPVHTVHAQIGDDRAGAAGRQAAQRLGAAGGGDGRVAGRAQTDGQQLAQVGVVIHQKNGCGHGVGSAAAVLELGLQRFDLVDLLLQGLDVFLRLLQGELLRGIALQQGDEVAHRHIVSAGSHTFKQILCKFGVARLAARQQQHGELQLFGNPAPLAQRQQPRRLALQRRAHGLRGVAQQAVEGGFVEAIGRGRAGGRWCGHLSQPRQFGAGRQRERQREGKNEALA